MDTYDVIVVGVGGMGSAAAYHLAQRGLRVLGIEQYDIPHDRGSSHGLSRIIRLAYFEHPAYVPLLHRAYELWWALERTVQERLLIMTGSLDIGTEASPVFAGALTAARQHHLVHEVLTRRPSIGAFQVMACQPHSWACINLKVDSLPPSVAWWRMCMPRYATAPSSMGAKPCKRGTALLQASWCAPHAGRIGRSAWC